MMKRKKKRNRKSNYLQKEKRSQKTNDEKDPGSNNHFRPRGRG